MSKRKKVDTIPEPLESEIQAQCMQALKMLGLVPDRQNTGAATYQNADGSNRQVQFGKRGNPDITLILPDGRQCGIEVKKGGKKPTATQLDRIRHINNNKGVSFFVTDPEQIMRVMPLILKGFWVEEDDDGNFFATDERIINA